MKAHLRTKLLGSVLLSLVFLVAVGSIGLYAAQRSLDGMHAAVEHHLREVNLVGQLASDVHVLESSLLLHVLSQSDAEEQTYEQQIDALATDATARLDELIAIQVQFGDAADLETIAAFQTAWADFERIRTQQFLPLSREGRDVEALELIRENGALDQAYDQTAAALTTLQVGLPAESDAELLRVQDEFRSLRNLLLAVVLVAGCLAVGAGLWQSTSLARAIEALSRAARSVAAGELAARAQVATGDELQTLAESFNLMTGNLQVTTNRLNQQVQVLEAEVEERRRVEAALRDSEERFRSVTESVSDAIVSTDAAGRVLFWNRGARVIFGYDESEMLGQDIQRVAPSIRLGSTSRPVELNGVRRDGSGVPLELSIEEWRRGEDRFATLTIRDVTEQRAVERMKNEFVSMVSHELRTPMNSVIGMTDLLLRRPLGEPEREYAEAVRRSGESLLNVINDILDFSKIEAGRFELDVRPVDLRDVVEDVVSLLAEQAYARGLELNAIVDPRVPDQVLADAARVGQILTNLVGNAVKFTDLGDVQISVKLREQRAGALVVCFDVVDSGIGISAAARERLFEPFAQGDTSTTRQYGGTGLGLAISRRLAELMGGDIGVDSEPGRGSRFWFTVRCAPLPGPPRSAPREPNLEGERVLVVHDHPGVRATLRQSLSVHRVQASEAQDTAGALARLRAAADAGQPYAMVFVQEQSPAIDGDALAHAIRADARLTDTRLIAVRRRAMQPEPQPSGPVFAATLEQPVRRRALADALARARAVTSTPVPRVATAPAPRVASPPAVDRGVPGAADGPRVLVVDDTPLSQEVAARMLREIGCRVEIASNGRAALSALAAAGWSAFDLVLMDCQMPELDGFDATRAIRRRTTPEQRRLPIVAMTASATPADRERCLAAGMDDYLAKPVRLTDLEAAVRRWLPTPPRSLDLAALFASDAERRLRQLREATRDADAAGLRQAAHSLRGNAVAVGAEDMAELCARLEYLGQTGTVEGTAELIPSLEAAIARARGGLDAQPSHQR